MKIKIDCKILSEQISLCDACAEKFRNVFLGEYFSGIANLLSKISFAVEECESIEFERVEEE